MVGLPTKIIVTLLYLKSLLHGPHYVGISHGVYTMFIILYLLMNRIGLASTLVDE